MSSGLTNCPSTLINVITNLFACSSDTCERLLVLKTNNQPGGRLVHLHRTHLIHQLPCPEFICSRGMTHTILRRIGQSMRAKYGKRDAHGINLGINLFISVWIFDIHPPPEQDRRKGQKWRRQASLGFVLALKFQQVLIITCPSGHPFVVFLLSLFFLFLKCEPTACMPIQCWICMKEKRSSCGCTTWRSSGRLPLPSSDQPMLPLRSFY